jgi:hypothetical protein
MARVRCRTPGELPFYRLPYPVLLPLGPHREQGKILHVVHADMRLFLESESQLSLSGTKID